MDSSWEELARALGGSFAARVRGVISPKLELLTPDGETFGRLEEGAGGTRLEAGGLSAKLSPLPGGGYSIRTGGVETLTAEPEGSASELRLSSGGRTYGADLSPLRNNAVARSFGGGEIARVSGGLAGRRYEATFDAADPAALPIAISLLHHLTQLRSRAYRTGAPPPRAES